MDREKVIKGLEFTKAMMTFNPSTGDNIEPRNLNEANKTTYDACVGAIALLKEQGAQNGEWITIWREDDPYTSSHARCSICNRISERPTGGYCKWCGAKMSQEWGVDG